MKKLEKGAKKPLIILNKCTDCVNLDTQDNIVGFCNEIKMPIPVKTEKQCIFYKKTSNNI